MPTRPTASHVAGSRWLAFKNETDEPIPPFACMRIVGVYGVKSDEFPEDEDIDSEKDPRLMAILKVKKPTLGRDSEQYVFNGSQGVPAGSGGLCTRDYPCFAIYEGFGEEGPQPGDMLGPVAGSWKLGPGQDRWRAAGGAHEERVEIEEVSTGVRVAVPVCGEAIPARTETVAGEAECCIFKLGRVLEDGSHSLIPVLTETGELERAKVFNIYDTAFGPQNPGYESYLRITPDRQGRYLCDAPTGISSIAGAASTTLPPPTTPPPNAQNPCSGGCRYEWTGAHWNLTSNYCTPRTSTTPNPSSSTSSTSYTTPDPNNCLCPPNTSSTTSTSSTTPSGSSTSSTSTTTPNNGPCKCTYPSYCGETVGECAITSCTMLEVEPQVSCTSTTTGTTANCNTSTTTKAPGSPGGEGGPPGSGCSGCTYTGGPVGAACHYRAS
jgi:hypothetical protein